MIEKNLEKVRACSREKRFCRSSANGTLIASYLRLVRMIERRQHAPQPSAVEAPHELTVSSHRYGSRFLRYYHGDGIRDLGDADRGPMSSPHMRGIADVL